VGTLYANKVSVKSVSKNYGNVFHDSVQYQKIIYGSENFLAKIVSDSTKYFIELKNPTYKTDFDMVKIWGQPNKLSSTLFESKIVENEKDEILFKSVYSSNGMIVTKNGFHIVKTIDSLSLPLLKEVTLAPGVIQYKVEPAVYSTIDILYSNQCYFILTTLGFEKEYDYLDKMIVISAI
jgi:hypothetical protein